MKKQHPLERPPSVFFMSAETLAAFEDLTSLPYLYDDTVMNCITARYDEDLIYTWAGPILVAVNPFKILRDFYSMEKIANVYDILKAGNDHQEPHVFTVAGVAHRRLTSEIGLINQAVLVSGESGAGKTESAKFLLTYLTQAESDKLSSPLKGVWKGQRPEDIQLRILASNPILEAFGNAATLRNQNSSRFGKLIRLQYNGSSLKGAMIDTYLLEKTRVTSQPFDERNFHIFYQLMAGIDNNDLPDLEFCKEDTFLITPKRGTRDCLKDLASFRETRKAFEEVGVPIDVQTQVFRVVVAIMYLGNIQFQFSQVKEGWIISSNEDSAKGLRLASELLGLPMNRMAEVITVKKITVASKNETTVFNKICEREDECRARRDSLMQLLYSAIFSYLVATLNSKTSITSSLWTSYLGILDIYGFEAFDQNSLEQLCINYANERLQQEFTRRYIASEHRLLIEEGFLNFPLIYSDNARCVSALDSPVSVFAILNEECQLRRALHEDETCERVCNALHSTGIVSPTLSRDKCGFIIRHYAGEVSYTSSGLLHKNKDEVPQDVLSLVIESDKNFVANLYTMMEEKHGPKQQRSCERGRKKRITTLSKFKSSLDSLMKILTQCDLHYVRCLKPNVSCVPGKPDLSFLLDQLKTNGILETVKISQAGYPIRMTYADFENRYNFGNLNPDFNNKEICFSILLEVFGSDSSSTPPQDKCRFGKNRIFLSESALHKLEGIRELRKHSAATCIQKHFKRYLVQKSFKKTFQAVTLIQRTGKVWLCRKRFLKKKESAIMIQKQFRCFVQRRKYEKILKSVKLIQKYYKKWMHRRNAAVKTVSPSHIRASVRPGSRISITSSCYGSLAPASLTDYSNSDAETVASEDLFAKERRRMFENEESGIETDTESLSGEVHNAGRASRLRTRHDHSSLKAPLRISDEEGFEVPHALATPRVDLSLSLRRRFPDAYRRNAKHVQAPTKIEFASLKDLKNTSQPIMKRHSSLRSLKQSIASLQLPVFFKDGVLSYRRLPKGSIKFHVRPTCLPYSTCVPIYERPQGLIDAVR